MRFDFFVLHKGQTQPFLVNWACKKICRWFFSSPVPLFSLNVSFAFNRVINNVRCAAQRVIAGQNEKQKKNWNSFFLPLFRSFGSRVQHRNRETRVQTHISDVCTVSCAVSVFSLGSGRCGDRENLKMNAKRCRNNPLWLVWSDGWLSKRVRENR